MSSPVFLDSNILIYAYSQKANPKVTKAAGLLRQFWSAPEQPWLSIQVLQEVHVNLVKGGHTISDARQIVEAYLAWPIVENTKDTLRLALEVQASYMISFWDAHIIAAAQTVGATELWTEDLNPGQNYGGVVVHNPLI